MNGVLLIKKEKEFTSFDVVAVVRKTLNIKKVGHMGTLDPNAEGVLPVLVGSATKGQDFLFSHDKQYHASFKLGYTTDTLDIWGTVVEEKPKKISRTLLEETLSRFLGEIEQIPPMYSAVSVGGKRLYQYAREGKTVERKPRKVTVYALDLLSFDEETGEGELFLSCSGGTYVRTLIDDVARAMDTRGVMTALTRTAACGFELSETVSLDELKAIVSNAESVEAAFDQTNREGKRFFREIGSCCEKFDAITVSEKQAFRFKNGNPLDLDRTALKKCEEDGKIVRVLDPENQLLALGITDQENRQLKFFKQF